MIRVTKCEEKRTDGEDRGEEDGRQRMNKTDGGIRARKKSEVLHKDDICWWIHSERRSFFHPSLAPLSLHDLLLQQRPQQEVTSGSAADGTHHASRCVTVLQFKGRLHPPVTRPALACDWSGWRGASPVSQPEAIRWPLSFESPLYTHTAPVFVFCCLCEDQL